MKDLLFLKRLYLPILALEKPNSKSDEEWEFEHEEVCEYIRQWVEDNVVNHIANETRARTLWYKLETLYASKTGNNKLFLLKQAMNLRYKEGSSILDHLNEFQGCFDQLSSMGVKFDEDIQGLWLLNTLPDSWENFRVSLTNSAPNGIVTMEYVKSSVLNEEVRRKTQGSSSSHSEVLVTKKRGRSKNRGQGQNCRGKSRSKSRENKPENSKQEKNDDGKHNDQVATVTSKDFFILYDDDAVNVASQETSCVIDSGASIHATSRKDLFTSYTIGDFGTIKMGNDGLAKVIGIRDACLEMDNGSSLILRDVKDIFNICLNLISTGRLDDEGYCNPFSDGQWKLARGAMDPVEKKLVRSRDVVFVEDQTIQDVEKAKKVVPQYNDGLIDLDLVPLTDLPTNVEHDVQDDQQDLDDADAPMQGETDY
ncbi:hypothetical protein Patl1_04799 [Pistacia atlantica]|uniref:Uncharacterized protein n=1 Tax=Pistacia atlantica TaxID=434234 RepID=A0ACC1BV01_9ROSI|nr:hypothetical protein Patl1_04799 [Pistacia atlantica]